MFKIVGMLIVVLLVYIGVPVGTWWFLAPETFWQRLCYSAVFGAYEILMVIIGLIAYNAGRNEAAGEASEDEQEQDPNSSL